MTPRLLVAVALVAASLVSIDTAPAQTATTREAASKPGWATDPAAVDLAADKGVSLAEAQRRISVQQRAPDPLYGGAPCNGTGVEVLGENWSGPWKKDRDSTGHSDACGPYRLIQATSPAGHSANGMTVVTPEGNRIRYSHLYTDRPFNSGATCP